jgi:hypothetical protein
MPILLLAILIASMDGVFLCKVTYNLFSNLYGLPFFFHMLLFFKIIWYILVFFKTIPTLLEGPLQKGQPTKK